MTNSERLDQARRLADHGKPEEALELIRGMDMTKIRALTELSAAADIYEANGLLEDALALAKRAGEKSRTRRGLYQLTALCIKLQRLEEAERYYLEYCQVVGEDADRYALRFLLDRLQGAAPEVQIASLEALKEYEYMEEWAYELARLYRKAGQEEKCIQECREIELWFGSGEIVDKARRMRHKLEGSSADEEMEPEQMTLQFEEELFEEEDPNQLSLQFEEDPLEELTRIDTAAIEEAMEEDDPEVEVEFFEMEPEEEEDDSDVEVEFFEIEPTAAEEAPEEMVPQENVPESLEMQTELVIPADSLVELAVTLLQEDDYILIQEQIDWLSEEAAQIRAQFADEESGRLQMERRVHEIIDRAEQRNMVGLLEVAESGSWLESGLLRLEKEDFYA